MKQKKRSSKIWIFFIIAFFSLLIIGVVASYYIFGFNFWLGKNKNMDILQNPLINLTDEQAVAQFNESFVLYLLASIGAQKLHSPPLSSDTPKIGIHVGEEVYSSEIKKGWIDVSKENYDAEKVDIVLRTSKEEAVKMMRNRDNIVKSFNEGRSSLEIVATKSELLVKGYLNIYSELTGETLDEE
jgi:hypothetical protein